MNEHWLWPFELDTLSSISDKFTYTAVSDKMLTPESEATHGCGEVAIMYKKSINAVPLTSLSNDRMCCIMLNLLAGQCDDLLTIIGTYMPCTNYPLDEYKEYLSKLEQAILSTPHDGLVIITGNFNAHLGSLAGSHNPHSPNGRGLLLKELIDRTFSYSVSDSSMASDPSYTFSSGTHFTTVDYIFASQNLASLIESCGIMDEHELNTSDHLPIIATLSKAKLVDTPSQVSTTKTKINWREACRTHFTLLYTSQVDNKLSHLINKEYEDISEVESDICFLTNTLLKSAEQTLPHIQQKKQQKKIHNPTLKRLCSQSCQAFWDWKQAGRPRSGAIFDTRVAAKRAVQNCLNKCRANIEHQRLAKSGQLV